MQASRWEAPPPHWLYRAEARRGSPRLRRCGRGPRRWYLRRLPAQEHTRASRCTPTRSWTGKVQKVMVLRNTWDRSSWLEAQALIARIFGQITALSSPSNGDEEVRVHQGTQKESPRLSSGAFGRGPGLGGKGLARDYRNNATSDPRFRWGRERKAPGHGRAVTARSPSGRPP
jgi:hypothetical protein